MWEAPGGSAVTVGAGDLRRGDNFGFTVMIQMQLIVLLNVGALLCAASGIGEDYVPAYAKSTTSSRARVNATLGEAPMKQKPEEAPVRPEQNGQSELEDTDRRKYYECQ